MDLICLLQVIALASGILRDVEGNWLKGFVHNLRKCNVVNAELWALFRGIELAQNEGYKNICI